MTDILVLERARVALQEHHDWHLGQTETIELLHVIGADDYSDSSLCNKTIEALIRLEEEIRRRTQPSPEPVAIVKPNHPDDCECPNCWEAMEHGGQKA